ncbi:protein of unknown function [Nitrospira japonica]|uniref:Uncharacterized protein n=1 Tax=Nitrospira japonica TaxID=1325564 RepID=A0A1W1I034_9BACT|nr:protein of unknown function [Nitrospira japonica]
MGPPRYADLEYEYVDVRLEDPLEPACADGGLDFREDMSDLKIR